MVLLIGNNVRKHRTGSELENGAWKNQHEGDADVVHGHGHGTAVRGILGSDDVRMVAVSIRYDGGAEEDAVVMC